MKRNINNICTGTHSSKWEERFSEKYKRKYWYDFITNTSKWEKPDEIDSNIAIADNKHDFPISTTSELDAINDQTIWIKKDSNTYNCDYWYNTKTNEKTWIDPNSNKESRADLDKQIKEIIAKEREATLVHEPLCPREITSKNLLHLVERLKTDPIQIDTSNNEYKIIFKLANDDTSLITRCTQEDQILKTKLKLRINNNSVIDLPSFWEVWKQNPEFRKLIINSNDPNEEKWKLQKKFNYKIATNFMPGIY